VSEPPAKGYAPYVAGWKRRFAERSEAMRRRAEEARSAAERCARLLAERHGARRVWLFGSTLAPETFHERSDIDLAAEGVHDWMGALLDCDAVAPGFDVTLVPIESAHEALRATVLEDGILLYGAPA